MKEKMSLEKKTKLLYSGELILVAIAALVIGILKLTGVIVTKPNRLLVYNIISFIGGIFYIGNFIWALFSPKKMKKTCVLDVMITLPGLMYLILFDMYCFYKGVGNVDDIVVIYSVGLVLIYLAAIYIFQGIYHYFFPTPQLLLALQEEEEEIKEVDTLEKEESKPEEDNEKGNE